MRVRGVLGAAVILLPVAAAAQTTAGPLQLEATIPLGPVSGRIDHLGHDLKRQRLFIAELGNDSLGVVDLAGRKLLRRVGGLKEPQGVAYEPTTDTVYVANAGDGSVRLLRGEDLSAVRRIDLGDDADNVRIDSARKRVLVGYGEGAIAIIDPAGQAKLAEIRLQAHPESFQIDESGARAFVNVPGAHRIDVLDLAKRVVIGAFPTHDKGANFPMAFDRDADRLLVVFRSPPRLLALSARDGAVVADIDTCADADDLFVDARRRRVYVSCGAGVVDVFEQAVGGYRRVGQVATVRGPRTPLFVPEIDRLFVAARAAGGEPATLWVFRPVP